MIVNLQASPLADTARVEEDVAHALYTYLNPLVGGSAAGIGPGWAFGRALNQGELYGVVHAVDGVEFVKILRIYETNLETGEQSPKPAGTHIVLEPDELIASGAHIVKATAPGGVSVADAATQNGGDEYRTFSGAGFGTLMVRLASGPKETPPVASSRAYLRGALPAVYQEGDFGMRFIGALETLLDPIVAVLDALPAHFSADHAPRDVLDLLSAWLGVDLDESQTPAQRRAMVRQAAELGRRRGTRARARPGALAGVPEPAAARRGPRRGEDGSTRGGNGRAAGDVHRVLRQADRGRGAGGRRPLHRAVQAGRTRRYRLRVKAAKKKRPEGEQG